MVEKIWRSIDPEFFTLVEDILEDTLQSVAPKFIVCIWLFFIFIYYALVSDFSSNRKQSKCLTSISVCKLRESKCKS
jgi:hypothetical protein